MLIAAGDTESTGLEPGSRTVEIAAVLFDEETGDVKDRFERLVFPDMPMPPDVSDIHSITHEMVEGQESAAFVLGEFFDWLPKGTPIAFHNASFDCGLIAWDAARVGFPLNTQHPVIDTLEIAMKIAATRSNKLAALVKHYQIETIGEAHRAAADADAVMKYYLTVRGQHSVGPQPWLFTGYDYGYTDELPESMSDIIPCTATGTELDFAYVDSKGKATERTIIPYGWARQNGELYFHGMCLLRKGERRTFRMDRVQSVQAA